MPLPAQQVYAPEFDRAFFRLPESVQRDLEQKIDFPGAHLKEFRHQRLRGTFACKLRVEDYRVIYSFDLAANLLHLITMGHRSKVYRDL